LILVLGSVEDSLVAALLDRNQDEDKRLAGAIQWCSEAELFVSPFAIERQRQSVRGYLQIKESKIDFRDLEGIVLRLPRTWWPDQEFDLQDQMFVYHETIASWFSVFDALPCPLVNRFGLGWWLQDLSYPAQLRTSLGRALNVAVTESNEQETAGGRIVATARNVDGWQSVYRAGGATIPAAGCSQELLMYLATREQALSRWEQETGITLSRLDFDGGQLPRLMCVETQPPFNEEPGELVEEAAAALLKRMTRACEVAA